MTQTALTPHLPPEAIRQLFKYFPDFVKTALQEKSSELECSLEATIEMACSSRYPQGVASFLDEEAFSFEDCLLAQRQKESVS